MSGWGTLVAGGKQPDVLQEVNVETMTNTEVKCVDHGIMGRRFPDGGLLRYRK